EFWGPMIFIVAQIVQIVFPVIPGGVTTVAGFLIFGPTLGFIYNYIGIIIGSVILFWLVKFYGRKFVLLFMDQKTFDKYESKLETSGYEKFFIFCMASPISPADIMVMITGLSNMSIKRFVTIIMITKPISIIGYSYLWIYGGDILKNFLN
ncbi:TPA: TVP38/TMEM64 family protein, partial [Streptococcus agalactiae]|nr:TVP38/TMEM64 family protein [Streptococcus agalactiae]